MTTISRRQPARADLRDWMTRMFEERFLPERFGLGSSFGERDLLRVEEFTDGSAVVVRAEIPGIDPDKDVEISIRDGMLHIRAERRELSEHTGKAEYRSEFQYGMFERVLPLASGVTEEDVTATYKDGILEVRLPKAKDAHATTVPVTRLP